MIAAKLSVVTSLLFLLVQAAADPAAVAIVMKWTTESRAIKAFGSDIAFIRSIPLRNRTVEYSGRLISRKPDEIRLRLDNKTVVGQYCDPNDYAAYIWNGRTAAEYDGVSKTVTAMRVGSLPTSLDPRKDFANWWIRKLCSKPLAIRLACDSYTVFDLLEKYEVKKLKEDANYVYLELKSRGTKDEESFETVQLVLHGPEVPKPIMPYSIRTIVITSRNRQDVSTWDFTNRQLLDKVDSKYFEFVEPPEGWKLVGSP